MDWMKIGSLMLLVGMLVMIWPNARHWMQNSPKGSSREWLGALIPLALVIGFVALLVKMI